MQLAITLDDIKNLNVTDAMRQGIDEWVSSITQDYSWDELSAEGGTGYVIVLDSSDDPSESKNLAEIYRGGSSESDWIGECSQCFLDEDLLFEYVEKVSGGFLAVNIVSDEGWGVTYFIPQEVYDANEDVRNRVDAEM